MAKSKKINYKKSIERLNEILEKLENQEGDIDQLMKDVEEATEIIKTCRTQLRSVEDQLSNKFNDLEDQD